MDVLKGQGIQELIQGIKDKPEKSKCSWLVLQKASDGKGRYSYCHWRHSAKICLQIQIYKGHVGKIKYRLPSTISCNQIKLFTSQIGTWYSSEKLLGGHIAEPEA